MPEVCLETIPVIDCALNGQEKVLGAFYAFAAGLADEMVVMPFFRMMINKPVIEFAFIHTSEFFEELQGAVDG